MYIKRRPPGKGGLTFRQRRYRPSAFLVALYISLLGAAVYVFLHVGRLRLVVSAVLGPAPTVTPRAEEYRLRAEALYLSGDLVSAADAYRRALDLEPDNIDLMYELSRMLTLVAQLDPLIWRQQTTETLEEALAVADRLVALAPRDPRGYAARARAYDYLGDAQRAVLEANRAVALDADYAAGYAYLAEAYADLNQLHQAREAAERAIALDPYSVDARRNYGYVLEFYGDYGGAMQQYLQAIQLHGHLLDLQYGLARNYRASGQLEQAVTSYNRIIRQASEDPRAYTELGRTYLQFGDHQAAQSVLEKAVARACRQTQERVSSPRASAPSTASSCPRMTYEALALNGYHYDSSLLPGEIYIPAWQALGEVYHLRREHESAVAILEEMAAFCEEQGEAMPVEASVVLAAAYYYLDEGPGGEPLCDRALDYAGDGLAAYEQRGMDEPILLDNILKVYVLCRDWTLTPPTLPVQFPAGCEEPAVIVRRVGGQVIVEEVLEDGG